MRSIKIRGYTNNAEYCSSYNVKYSSASNKYAFFKSISAVVIYVNKK